jgi:hypothetical protein
MWRAMMSCYYLRDASNFGYVQSLIKKYLGVEEEKLFQSSMQNILIDGKHQNLRLSALRTLGYTKSIPYDVYSRWVFVCSPETEAALSDDKGKYQKYGFGSMKMPIVEEGQFGFEFE